MKKIQLISMILSASMLATPVFAADSFFDVQRPSIEDYFNQYTKGFTDTAGHWAEQQIYEAVDLGYVSGTSETQFSPDLPMTRAMLVTMLYRMAGQPEITIKNNYTDIPAGCWYEKAALWTVEKLISYSQSDTFFGIDAQATREQIVTMLYRYARTMGYDVSQYGNTTGFADSNDISPASKAAVSWAVANGLISGKENNRLEPKASATRAEVVAIFMRFWHLNEGDR